MKKLTRRPNRLGPAKKDRFTLDMRVTDYLLNSCDPAAYYHQNPKVTADFRYSKNCIAMIFGYDSYHHALSVMFTPEIADKCAHTPLFYFTVHAKNVDIDFEDNFLYFTPKALANHKKFAKSYFDAKDNYTIPEKARKCIVETSLI